MTGIYYEKLNLCLFIDLHPLPSLKFCYTFLLFLLEASRCKKLGIGMAYKL